MKQKYTYLNDVSFLKEVAKSHIQTYFVKINILNWKEELIEPIQGRVVSGSINIDGKSAIRRTLSLNVYIDGMTNRITNANNLLSINKKIQVEIGIKNIFSEYTQYETLWFPQGVYIIASCNISYDSNGITAAIQARDKMCLLNGECGGTFPATTQLDVYETIDSTGAYTVQRPTIYQIIQELVNHFGGQQLGKIIISDVDPLVKQAVQWGNEAPLYRFTKTASGGSAADADYFYSVNYNQYDGQSSISREDIYPLGKDVGYIYTDFTYPASTNTEEISNFICQAGSTVTQALDKIISEVLGNYEYFYDVNGNFIFRQIKNYLNNAQSKYISEYNNRQVNDDYYKQLLPDYINEQNYSPYLFEINKGTSAISLANDNDLIISYNNSPQYGLIKNDIIVWGIRKDLEGYEYPLRYHLAIDEKPKVNVTYRAFKVEEDGYQTWYAAAPLESESKLPNPGTVNLYWEINDKIKTWNPTLQKYEEVKDVTVQDIVATDWRTVLLLQGTLAEPYGVDSNYYYAELKYEWPKIYDIENHQFRESTILYPNEINYYLDFIDANSYLDQLSVGNIGRRTKVLNEKNNVNCVFEPDIPDMVFVNTEEVSDNISGKEDNSSTNWSNEVSFDGDADRIVKFCKQYGQPYYKLESSLYDNLVIGGLSHSAYQVVRQLLQEYISYNETITIQCLPMYFLQPNERITLYNAESNIYGDYMINSMSFSFDVSSTLTINASRVLTKI